VYGYENVVVSFSPDGRGQAGVGGYEDEI